jgi:cytochrome c peroxidase
MTKAIFFILVLSFLTSCRKEKVSFIPTPYAIDIPSHFPQMNIPEDNPMTEEGIELGRFLFYETKLSGDNTMSCASCHQLNSSFADNVALPLGIQGIAGTRNSMPLFNLGWDDFFTWDGRKTSLEGQILEPVPNPIEMHLKWTDAVDKLQLDVSYRNKFFRAFGEEGIDSMKVAKSIAQFIRTIISANSTFDVMYKFENGLPLTTSENSTLVNIEAEVWAGYDLFKSLNGADCFHCHNGPLMRVKKFSNNGLDMVFSDQGRALVTQNINDEGKFKVPSLRNLSATGPYMHDGRFNSLEEVIEHYSTGIQQSETLDPLIEFANQGGVQLDELEKQWLKKFLLSLNDTTYINNPKFKDPFN